MKAIKLYRHYLLVVFISSVTCFSGCTVDNEKNQVRRFVAEFKVVLAENDLPLAKAYCSELGWESLSKNFEDDQAFKSFATFFNNLPITEIEKMEDNRIRVVFSTNRVTENVGIILKKDASSYKVDRYLAGKKAICY